MRIKLPELENKAMFDYLVKNKKELIRQKKLLPIKSQDLFSTSEMIMPLKTNEIDEKAAKTEEPVDTGKLLVEVVGNAAWFVDYGMDVLVDTGYDKSIKEQGALLPHIKNHDHSADAHVGDVQEVYRKAVALKRLGFDMKGSTQCICWKTIIRKDYDEKIYMFYKNGKINQHSICLQYHSIGLCINDKNYLPEYELWSKYYDKIINKEAIDTKKFFWIVPEFKVFENSCVLFGMNMLTPTLSTEEKEGDITVPPPVVTTTEGPKKKRLNFKPII